jgi:hypothetical protein
LLDKKDELKIQDKVCNILDLNQVKERNVEELSGGELQRYYKNTRRSNKKMYYSRRRKISACFIISVLPSPEYLTGFNQHFDPNIFKHPVRLIVQKKIIIKIGKMLIPSGFKLSNFFNKNIPNLEAVFLPIGGGD